ncbi:unnamed protein product [Oppiella nova]|uniref:Protein kinase domain-containing protein n=1 Tax=Oppiella nova TaxID=334625 RepID=A0A7R9LUU8_9ACAR|nr:unnamed protein product [Oppiella nova]CAG2167078.1 unnamed protein product [Oppiella nova]
MAINIVVKPVKQDVQFRHFYRVNSQILLHTDFGLAKEVVNIDSYNMSKAKHTADVGNVDYMAPEAEDNDYNHLIDIYSLSLIGAQIFGFDTYDIIEGKQTNVRMEKYLAIHPI